MVKVQSGVSFCKLIMSSEQQFPMALLFQGASSVDLAYSAGFSLFTDLLRACFLIPVQLARDIEGLQSSVCHFVLYGA